MTKSERTQLVQKFSDTADQITAIATKFTVNGGDIPADHRTYTKLIEALSEFQFLAGLPRISDSQPAYCPSCQRTVNTEPYENQRPGKRVSQDVSLRQCAECGTQLADWLMKKAVTA